MPAGLDHPGALHLLHGESAVADELASVRLDHPQPEPVVHVVAAVPLDPAGRSAGAADLQRGDVSEVRLGHLAEAKSSRGVGQHPATLVPRAASRVATPPMHWCEYPIATDATEEAILMRLHISMEELDRGAVVVHDEGDRLRRQPSMLR